VDVSGATAWKRPAAVGALLALCLSACCDSVPDSTPKSGEDPEIALRVNAGTPVPVTHAEIARVAELLKFATFEGTQEHHERTALREVVLPRAAIRSANAAAFEEAMQLARRLQDQLVDGQAHPDEAPKRGDLDLFGPLVVGTAIELEDGVWSGPIENLGSIQFIRVMDRPRPGQRSMELALITIPFASNLGGFADVERYLDDAVLEIVDPRYEEIIPTRILHLMEPESD
jgi:hypothetical protein